MRSGVGLVLLGFANGLTLASALVPGNQLVYLTAPGVFLVLVGLLLVTRWELT